MTNMDHNATDNAAHLGAPYNFVTVLDNLAPPFTIVECLSTPNTTTVYMSELFSMLERVFVAQHLVHHTCAPRHGEGVFSCRSGIPSS